MEVSILCFLLLIIEGASLALSRNRYERYCDTVLSTDEEFHHLLKEDNYREKHDNISGKN